jgi:hypothetical protein
LGVRRMISFMQKWACCTRRRRNAG